MSAKEETSGNHNAAVLRALRDKEGVAASILQRAIVERGAEIGSPWEWDEWKGLAGGVVDLFLRVLESGEPNDRITLGARGDVRDFCAAGVRMFRDRRMTIETSWEFMKLVRLGILDFLNRAIREDFGAVGAPLAGEQFFDALEFGLLSLWLREESHHYHRKLREAHHYILLEKRRYHTVFHKINEPALVIDSNRMIIDVNRAFEEFSGKKAAEVRGENCCTLMGQRICGECDLESVLSEKGSFSNMQLEIVFNGKKRTILLAGSYLGLINGRHAGWIIIFQDVTEKRRIEAQLRESEEKYRSLIQNMPDVTWRCDEAGRIIFISPNVEEVTAFTPEDIAMGGRSGWFQRIHSEDRESACQEIGFLFSRGKVLDIKYRFCRKDGEWIWIHERSGMPYSRKGIRMVDGVLADVTRVKKIEEELAVHHLRLAEQVDKRTAELRHANVVLQKQIQERVRVEEELMHLANRLKASNLELEQFAHVASHDLKEPLLLIIAFGERLQRRCTDKLDEKGMEYLSRILRAAKQMQDLIEDLLQLSRVTTRGRPFEEINLMELMRDLVLHLEERIIRERASIQIHPLNSLMGDRTQVWQLFLNIINNALKYRKDSESPVVRIKSRIVENDLCEITVEDNGIGFEEKFLEEIFTPFKRLHSHAKYEGTGIGLATCKKIVLRHGGEITAKSKVGEGSTFIIRLPLMPPNPE